MHHFMKIYGPYLRKDGRKHIVIQQDKKLKTKSYPRFLLEQHLGRELTEDETVDHIDGDFTNDDISNLQILSRAENAIKALEHDVKVVLTCAECGKDFERKKVFEKLSRARRKSGPFCSHSCCVKYKSRKSRSLN